MAVLDWLTGRSQPKPKTKKTVAPRKKSVATHTRRKAPATRFPQAHAGATTRRAGTPITGKARIGNALLGNTDSQIDRRLVQSGRPVDPVTAAYHSPSGNASDPVGGTGSRGGRGGGAGGGSSALSKEQRQAADRLQELARYNTTTATGQLDRQLGIYDAADRQNRQLAGVEKKQHSMDTADDRFLRMKNLQAATHGINNASGPAMQGSAQGALAQMLDNRNDMDTTEGLTTLRSNWNSVENALAESLNSNVLARRGAISDTERALRTIRADTSAQLGNIDQRLFVSPDKLKNIANPLPNTSKYNPKEYAAKLAGYIR